MRTISLVALAHGLSHFFQIATAVVFPLIKDDLDVSYAALGGTVYGFSPAVLHSAIGHYDLQFAVLPPLIIHVALRLATGRAGAVRGGRVHG